MTTRTATLGDAVRFIASRCDGAITEDGVGFNGHDTHFGKRLAALPDTQWTDEMRWSCWKMLRLYRGQLLQAEIDYDALPVPLRPADPEEERFWWEDAHEQARRRSGRRFTVKQDGADFLLSFPYDSRMLDALKAAVPYQARRWDGQNRVWRVAHAGFAGLRAFLAAHDEFMLDPDVELALAGVAAAPDAPRSATGVEQQGDRLLVRFPIDQGMNSQLKQSVPGVRWDRDAGAWSAPLSSSPHVLTFAEGYSLTVADDLIASVTEEARRVQEMLAASRATDAELDIPLPPGRELRPFQRAGVAYILRTKHTLLGDEQGLGKTVEMLAALGATESVPAVIVCPATLKPNWFSEALRWIPQYRARVLDGRRPSRAALIGFQVFIINYEVLGDWLPVLPALKAVFIDEAQNIKSAAAARTKACMKLTKLVDPDGLVVLATGTPVVNRQMELVPLIEVLDRMEVFGSTAKFRKRYRYGNLPELNSKMRASFYIRRLKKDVLTELPAKVWADLPMDQFDPAALRLYQDAERDILATVARLASEAAEELGEDPRSAAVEARIRAAGAQHLVQLNLLRQLAARAKLPGVRAWIRDFLTSGKKLVVFAWHQAVVDDLAAEYNAPKIRGGSSPAARQAVVERFQRDDSCRMIVCSIPAAGVGLTLTAASDVLFVEEPWTPAGEDQAADRVHRIGQRDSVTAWRALALGLIDMDMVELISTKRTIVKAATEGEEVEQTSMAGELLVRLARRAQENKPA